MESRHLPPPHRAFLHQAVPRLQALEGFVGLAAGGSYIAPGLDEHSDLDLVVVVSDPQLPFDRARRMEIVGGLGDMIAAFTAEHVGEPRLLICLYGPWPLHVDLKFTTLEGFQSRVEDPIVLIDPSGELARTIAEYPGHYPESDLQWAEDRMWIWIHYAALKLRRGEFLTAKQTADFILQRIIGPLIAEREGFQPNQLRRLEQIAPPELAAINAIAAANGHEQIKAAIALVGEIYVALRDASGKELNLNPRAQAECLRFLAES
ncbi:MAG: hypothetical protein P4L46_01320 [Fimbriimonas sp.]|nr:hypothetical protein [Fimbriimonas sp.]